MRTKNLKEHWKQIRDYEFYEVSNLGRVRSWHPGGTKKGRLHTPKLKTLGINKYGYLRVNLYRNQKLVNLCIHTIVLETFVSPRPKGLEASHINGNSKDNRVFNLKWESHLINNRRRKEHGTWVCGPNNPLFGKAKSEETKRKISEKLRGVKLSEKHKQNMALGKLARKTKLFKIIER